MGDVQVREVECSGGLGDWGDECSASGEDGEDFYSNFLQHLLENVN